MGLMVLLLHVQTGVKWLGHIQTGSSTKDVCVRRVERGWGMY